MAKSNPKDAKRAHRLSAQIMKGKPPAVEDMVWLAGYKKRMGRPMPTGPAGGKWGASFRGPVAIPGNTANLPTNVPAPPDDDSGPPPLPSDAIPGLEGGSMSASGFSEASGDMPPGSEPPNGLGSSPSVNRPVAERMDAPSSAPTGEQLELAGTLATGFVALLSHYNGELRAAGKMALEDSLISSMVHPAATRLILKNLPASATSDDADMAIVCGAVGFVGWQTTMLKLAQKREAKLAAQKAAQSWREAPAKASPATLADSPTEAPPVSVPRPVEVDPGPPRGWVG